MFYLNRGGVVGALAAAYKCGKLTAQAFSEYIDYLNDAVGVCALINFIGESTQLSIYADTNIRPLVLTFTRDSIFWRN